jgi:response regulator RpfG family c-di-GMP phosphodiesterase
LAEVKSDQDLRSIPVVMLSSSPTEEDIFRSYSLHANAYVTKPVNFECFSDVVGQIIDFFLTLVKQPNCAHDHYRSETDQAVADKRLGRLAHRRAAG